MTTEEFNSIMLADHGSLIIADAVEHKISHRAIVVRSDTVIEAWTDEKGNNLMTFYGVATKTLLVTDPALLIPGGGVGSILHLTSGSVWLIR